MKRNLDGIYFRIERDGEYDSICFSDLTDEEMETVMNDRGEEWLKSLAKKLGKTVRNIGDQMDIYCQ